MSSAELNERLARVVSSISSGEYSYPVVSDLVSHVSTSSSDSLRASLLDRLFPKMTGLTPLSTPQTLSLLRTLAHIVEEIPTVRVSLWASFVLERLSSPDLALLPDLAATAQKMLASSPPLTVRIATLHIANVAAAHHALATATDETQPHTHSSRLLSAGEGPVGLLLRAVANQAPDVVGSLLVSLLKKDAGGAGESALEEVAESAGESQADAQALAILKTMAALSLLHAIALDQGSRLHELVTPALLSVLIDSLVLDPETPHPILVSASVALFILLPLLPPLFVPFVENLLAIPASLLARMHPQALPEESDLPDEDAFGKTSLDSIPKPTAGGVGDTSAVPARVLLQVYSALLYGMFPAPFLTTIRSVFEGANDCAKMSLFKTMSRVPFNASSLAETSLSRDEPGERWQKPSVIVASALLPTFTPESDEDARLVRSLYSNAMLELAPPPTAPESLPGGSSSGAPPAGGIGLPSTQAVLGVKVAVEAAMMKDAQAAGTSVGLYVMHLEAALVLERFWCAMHKDRVRLLSRDVVDSAERESQNRALFRKVQSQRKAIQALHTLVEEEKATAAAHSAQAKATQSELKIQLEAANASLAQVTAENKAKDVMLSALRSDLEASNAELLRKNEAVLSLRSKLETALPLLERQAQYESALESMSHEFFRREAQYTAYRKSIDSSAALEAALASHRAAEASMQSQLDKACAEIQLLQSFSSQATQRVADVQTTNAQLVAALDHAKALLERQKAESDAERDALSAKYQNVKAINAGLVSALQTQQQHMRETDHAADQGNGSQTQ